MKALRGVCILGCLILLYACNLMFPHYPPMEVALDALVSDGTVTVTEVTVADWEEPQNVYYVFEPVGVTPTVGFIIYHGAYIDPRGYAPTARGIAARGYLVALPAMIGDLAISSPERAAVIQAAYPDIEYWGIGGHSVGGTAACSYARGEDSGIDGVVLWAAYPSFIFSLESSFLKAVSISATNDGLSRPSAIEGSAGDLPPDTVWVQIQGGNHTQFGWYGDGEELQVGDLPADISREEQQAILIDATASFLATLPPPVFSGIQQSWCGRAQRMVEDYTEAGMPDSMLVNTIFDTQNEFTDSKPTIDVDNGRILIYSLFKDGLASSMGYQQVWVKTKTSEAIDDSGLDAGPHGDPHECSLMNEEAIAWALDNVPASVRTAYEASGVTVAYLPDELLARGDQWVASEMTIEETAPATFEIKATNLRTAAWIPTVGGMNYCKLLSPDGAISFVNDVAAGN